MKILLIPSWYPSQSTPTKGVFFKEQAQALQKAGHTVIVADFHELWSLKNYLKTKHNYKKITFNNENGLFVYRFKGYDYVPKMNYLKKYFFNYRLKCLYKLIYEKHGHPDIIHAHGALFGGDSAVWLKNKINIPVILTEHTSYIGRKLLNKAYLLILSNTLKKVDSIIAVGPGLKDTLSAFIENDKIKVIPNCIDTEKFSNNPILKSNKHRRPFKFFSLALLSKNKGIDILIKAFSGISEKDIHLTIGGEGEESINLKKLAADLGVNKKITFLGELNRSQVVKQMKMCDVFVLPSRYETFGIVYIEALACGKPIIATDCGGPGIIVNDYNGYLVPVDNSQALSTSMEKIMRNYEEFDSRLIREDCIKRFSEKAVISQVEKVYNEVLNT